MKPIFFYFDSFHGESLLKAHIRNRHEQIEICEYCAKTFANKSALKTHLRKHSEENLSAKLKEKVQCTDCSAWLANRSAYSFHKLIHTDPIKCEKCHVTLSNQQSLYSQNLKFHKNGGLNHKCCICSKSFRCLSDMQVKW